MLKQELLSTIYDNLDVEIALKIPVMSSMLGADLAWYAESPYVLRVSHDMYRLAAAIDTSHSYHTFETLEELEKTALEDLLARADKSTLPNADFEELAKLTRVQSTMQWRADYDIELGAQYDFESDKLYLKAIESRHSNRPSEYQIDHQVSSLKELALLGSDITTVLSQLYEAMCQVDIYTSHYMFIDEWTSRTLSLTEFKSLAKKHLELNLVAQSLLNDDTEYNYGELEGIYQKAISIVN